MLKHTPKAVSLKKEAPIHISNLHTGRPEDACKATRIGRRVNARQVN